MLRKASGAMLGRCESAARSLKLLAHPQRLRILCHLADGEKTVRDLEALCGASQSLVSQSLARMRSEGLVACRRRGQFVAYHIEDPRILKLIVSLHEVFCPS
ncbi:MAG: winged helix-turn-helix transcriptional regulator [Elusimicrobia bacterium]|nr:winged helix-turn-helix transcriptional regulator [Elusimicrobiota bacterium]